ncbi:MAG TPA: hypothetical protein VE821_09275 [Pyrinomonadaceae bacterium]|nr:hypothetical protein [Pyrinomonadaceae bacterium]
MSRTKLTVALFALFLLTLAVEGRPHRRHKMKHPPKQVSTRVATGVWGGEHVRLQVTDDGATIEYDCAHGTLAGPLALDGQGRFSVTGTYAREGGPVRVDAAPAGVPARYTGSVQGRTLTLTTTLTDKDQNVGTFTLTQGSEGRLWKCR